ncbi:hypothetical protein [Methylobacterium aerolatum]|uniref:Uncharacterized protein n=1 Tax=Methylobacterium aerolatum TaxID=418708 RepID=A0ABU0I532_9HYPH|nr:hypothetical protein [Methylobacterium aerolatum]MDQ0449719.1 hypothetical protein [Methylobacterium aerolatum]GJD37174.1 hypothetical protein FMGBMHLM_4100 [Methylobacterium aerolatum]
MNYTVTARCAAGRRAHGHASLLAALDQALSLAAAGLAEVAIIDGDGRSRTPSALYQALFGPQVAQPQAKVA